MWLNWTLTFYNSNKILHDMITLLTQSYNTNLGIGVALCLKIDLLLLTIHNRMVKLRLHKLLVPLLLCVFFFV